MGLPLKHTHSVLLKETESILRSTNTTLAASEELIVKKMKMMMMMLMISVKYGDVITY